jgi:hypothetical protein
VFQSHAPAFLRTELNQLQARTFLISHALSTYRNAASTVQQQRETGPPLAPAAAEANNIDNGNIERGVEERVKAQAALVPTIARQITVDPALARAALDFVAAGDTLLKYTRAKLINGKPHDPRPKTVKMRGELVEWDKRAFTVANAKLGGSMTLRANRLCSDLDANFHVFLSGVSAGKDLLDFRAPSKQCAQNWVMGILASIGRLQSSL